MNWVKDLVSYISDLFKWYVVVMPWQAGIRVRMGKHKMILNAGVYVKFPIIDTVFVKNIRLRVVQIPTMTMTTNNGSTVTVTGLVSYSIENIDTLFNSIDNPDATLTGIAMGKISDFISISNVEDLNVQNIKKSINMEGHKYGLTAEVSITSLAVVKTYRLIQDHQWLPTDKVYEI